MDVAESPERDPRSPEDEEEEQQGLSDDDILRESGSDQDLDGAGGKASDLEDEDHGAPGLSQEEEESRSDEEDQDSEAQELSGGPASPPRVEEGDGGEEDCTSDLRDEASSVTRELDEHELDYDEEVPEEPAPALQEDDGEKAGPEDDDERGDGAPGEEGKADAPGVEDREPLEAAKERKKEDDDGEIDDGEIDTHGPASDWTARAPALDHIAKGRQDDDLEEGEVKDPSDRKVRPRPTCRFFMKGNCTWGMNCRFIHPGVNDKGNYSLITKAEPFPPNGAPPLGPHPLMPASPWGGPGVDEVLPPPPPEPPTESAWERGLRHAKEVTEPAQTGSGGGRLEPYADPYYDYEVERLWRSGQYENFRVQYSDAEPHHSYRVSSRPSPASRCEVAGLRTRLQWEACGDSVAPLQLYVSVWLLACLSPSRQAELPKKEAASTGPQVKRADEWKDPWRRSKSPKKKLGVSVSPSRARRRRKTSASSASASNSSRSSSRSSSYSGSGSSRSRSRSSSYSSYSSRSSRHSSFSGSRSREKSVKKPAPAPAPPQAPKTTAAPVPEPAKPGDPREARRRERQARTPPRRSLSVSSVSSVSSATSSSSSAHSVDSDDMYADLASPVSSASSRSPTPAQTKKEKGKSKKEDGVKADKRKRDPSTQPPKPSRPSAGSRPSQQPTAPQQAPPGQPQQGTFIAHKEIKLTLLNKVRPQVVVQGPRDPMAGPALAGSLVGSSTWAQVDSSRDRKSGGRLSSPKPERQRGQNSKAPVAPPDRKRPLSPQSKSSGKVTSVPGKASDSSAASASAGTKSGKASTLSRREELLKQLKAVEDAIARKRAKIPGKV
ncbi:hypothetical protein CB1_000130038 [Camelus ferus]|nr:hypothetical protein CB1_000130038 [Camelus ferus]